MRADCDLDGQSTSLDFTLKFGDVVVTQPRLLTEAARDGLRSTPGLLTSKGPPSSLVQLRTAVQPTMLVTQDAKRTSVELRKQCASVVTLLRHDPL